MKLQLAVLGVVVLATVAVAGASGGSAEPLAPADATLTATTATGKIVIARSDGSGRRFLTRAFASSISPDGARVAVIDFDLINNRLQNWRIELFASAGGAPTHVIAIECGQVYWSP